MVLLKVSLGYDIYHFLSHLLAKASHMAWLDISGVRKCTPPIGRNCRSCDNRQSYMILLQREEQTIGNNSKIRIISDMTCTQRREIYSAMQMISDDNMQSCLQGTQKWFIWADKAQPLNWLLVRCVREMYKNVNILGIQRLAGICELEKWRR